VGVGVGRDQTVRRADETSCWKGEIVLLLLGLFHLSAFYISGPDLLLFVATLITMGLFRAHTA
jgi:hypothetical protein